MRMCHIRVGLVYKRLSWGISFSRTEGGKVREFYAPAMVKDIRSRMCLFVAGLSHASSKEVLAGMLIDDMDISRLMIYVQQVEEEKLRDIEEYMKNKLKAYNEPRQ